MPPPAQCRRSAGALVDDGRRRSAAAAVPALIIDRASAAVARHRRRAARRAGCRGSVPQRGAQRVWCRAGSEDDDAAGAVLQRGARRAGCRGIVPQRAWWPARWSTTTAGAVSQLHPAPVDDGRASAAVARHRRSAA